MAYDRKPWEKGPKGKPRGKRDDRYGKGAQGPPGRGRQNYGRKGSKEAAPAPTLDPEAKMLRFEDLAISESTKSAVEAMGFIEATPIQTGTIPALLEGRDLIGQAQTGTGKTAAFGIPLIEAAAAGKRGLVLAPTRELAKQVQQELQAIAKGSVAEAICIVGGAPYKDQLRALERHPKAIVVATPGRVVDHLGRGTMDLSDVAIFVLDEADEMLSMGFQDELDAIVETLPAERQTIMFSATMPTAVERLAKKALKDPITVRAAAGPAPTIKQSQVQVAGKDRVEAIRRIIEAEDPTSALLFCKTRARVEDLVDQMRGVGAEALHGGMDQRTREGVMRRYREGTTRLLIATDVAARGLDVETVELVLHDDVPSDPDVYVHRIGRTGRAGREGHSIIFIPPGKLGKLSGISRVAGGKLEAYKVPGDEAIAQARAQRLVEELQAIEPSPAAYAAIDSLRDAGLDEKNVAVRLLEKLLVAPVEAEAEPARASSGTVGLALKVGKMDDVHPGAIVGVLTNAGGLRGEDIGRIDILEKMSVAEVPAADVERVCDALQRVRLSGRPLLPRVADDWTFRVAARR